MKKYKIIINADSLSLLLFIKNPITKSKNHDNNGVLQTYNREHPVSAVF